MALSEAEELELLELEEAEAQEAGQTPLESNPPAELTPSDPNAGDSKTRKFIRGVANALPTVGGVAGGVALGLPGTVFGMGVGGIPAAAAGAGLGAGAGTAGKQLILRALGDTEGVPQTMGEAAKEIGVNAAKDAAITAAGGLVLKGGVRAARLGKALITKPSAIEAGQLGKEALEEISSRGGQKLALARQTNEAAKKALIKAEEKGGFHFESTPEFEVFVKDPKKLADFSQKIGRLAKKTPEELAQALDTQTLQRFRKIAQEGEKFSQAYSRVNPEKALSDISESQLRQGKDVFTQALAIKDKGFGEALSRFRDTEKVVKEIPGQIREQLTKRKVRIGRNVTDARTLDRKRRVIKGLAKSAAYGLGGFGILKSIFK